MDARIRFYRITQCGYYDHDDFQFGGIADILENLKSWIEGKALNETQTYSVDPENNESDILRTFCYSIVANSDEYLMITWNENADVDGKMASIDGRGTTGHATIETVEPPEGFIPGYPSLFWIIPSRNLFATIQLNTHLNGRKNLDIYLNGFLATRSQYVVYEETNGENSIEGYGCSENDCRHLKPIFSSVLYRQPGQIEFIKNNRESIKKFIKKDKFNLERPETTTYWQAIYRFLTGKQTNVCCNVEKRISVELEMTPSAEELENIIAQWEADIEAFPVGDVGFSLVGHPQLFWLRQSIASQVFNLDIHPNGESILIPPSELLAELQRKRDIIFSIIRD